jgi:hypothetical protein
MQRLVHRLLSPETFCSGRESENKKPPARTGHGRGGTDEPECSPPQNTFQAMNASRFFRAMGEVARRTERRFFSKPGLRHATRQFRANSCQLSAYSRQLFIKTVAVVRLATPRSAGIANIRSRNWLAILPMSSPGFYRERFRLREGLAFDNGRRIRLPSIPFGLIW